MRIGLDHREGLAADRDALLDDPRACRGCQRTLQRVLPGRGVRLPPQRHAVAAEVVGGLQYQPRAVVTDPRREVHVLPAARARPSLGHHPRPRDVRPDHGMFVGTEAGGVRLVGQNGEERLLVRDLAPEGVGHAGEAVAIGLDQDPGVVRTRHQIGHQRTSVHQVDRLSRRDQPAVDDLQVTRIGDQRRHTTCGEVLARGSRTRSMSAHHGSR